MPSERRPKEVSRIAITYYLITNRAIVIKLAIAVELAILNKAIANKLAISNLLIYWIINCICAVGATAERRLGLPRRRRAAQARLSLSLSLYIYIYNIQCIYIYIFFFYLLFYLYINNIYIYIERERDREREIHTHTDSWPSATRVRACNSEALVEYGRMPHRSCLAQKKLSRASICLVYAWTTVGYGFIEFEISSSTCSTVFRQPLKLAVGGRTACPWLWSQASSQNNNKHMK